jgi:hypothetical protein
MKKLFIIAIGMIAFVSCGKKEEEKKVVTEQQMEQPEITVQDKECYLWTSKGKDTIKMSIITANGGNVVGDLEYNFFEKDGSVGKVSGMAKGDTIYATYDFQSEGMQSTRESVFLRKGNTLIEGFGEVETKGSNQIFKDKKALKFDGSVTLNKVDCVK